MRVTSVRTSSVVRVRGMRTGYGKQAAAGPVRLGKEGFDGDAQADRRYHGGADMAALAYAVAHYPRWREELSWPELGPGAFGENLPVEGADEHSVCIGDVWRVGSAVLQVASPRKPCSKISRFWQKPELLKLVVQSGRTGFYFRVLEEGVIEAGDEVVIADRPHPEWPVLRVFRIGMARAKDRATARATAQTVTALAERWKAWLRFEPADI
ncbi:MAG TPA: MOSC domain-containing protein [Myxococcales bacterium]